jgi:hypothetical protein
MYLRDESRSRIGSDAPRDEEDAAPFLTEGWRRFRHAIRRVLAIGLEEVVGFRSTVHRIFPGSVM